MVDPSLTYPLVFNKSNVKKYTLKGLIFAGINFRVLASTASINPREISEIDETAKIDVRENQSPRKSFFLVKECFSQFSVYFWH